MNREFSGTDTKLVNIRVVDDGVWDTYIGRESPSNGLRESPHHNPFKTSDFSREGAVDLFKVWFYHRVRTSPAYKMQVDQLEGRVLACWCVPKACHGEVIGRYLGSGGVDESELVSIADSFDSHSFDCLKDAEREEMKTAIEWFQNRSDS